MTSIKTLQDLLERIEETKFLIVFILHRWSGSSLISQKIVDEWSTIHARNIWLIDASSFESPNEIIEWIRQHSPNDLKSKNPFHGNGDIVWIKEKEIIDIETIYKQFDVTSLEERAVELFK